MNPRVRPFIVEFLTFIFVIIVIFLALFFTDTIVIKLNVLAVLCCITLFLWTVQYIFTFIIRDVLAIYDLICHHYTDTHVTFVEQFPYHSSTFATTKTSGKMTTSQGRVFFRVKFKYNSQIIDCFSSEYYHFISGHKYLIKTATHSKIIVDITDKS